MRSKRNESDNNQVATIDGDVANSYGKLLLMTVDNEGKVVSIYQILLVGMDGGVQRDSSEEDSIIGMAGDR